MSKRRLRNSIDENTQTSFSTSEESDSGEHWTDKFFDTMSDHGEDVDAAGNNEVNNDGVPEANQDDEAVETARQAVDRANAVLMAVPAAAVVPDGADPNATLMAQMLHAMQLQNAQSQLQNAQSQLQNAQSQLQYAKARLDDKLQQQKFQLQLEELRRQKDAPISGRLKPSVFDLEKGKDSFTTWKERWRYHVQESGCDKIRDPKVRAVKMRASLQQALSDFTVKWIHNQGFTAENLERT
jgi:multidrug efflux pump subunit AcrA (membrane-fusion protein)